MRIIKKKIKVWILNLVLLPICKLIKMRVSLMPVTLIFTMLSRVQAACFLSHYLVRQLFRDKMMQGFSNHPPISINIKIKKMSQIIIMKMKETKEAAYLVEVCLAIADHSLSREKFKIT